MIKLFVGKKDKTINGFSEVGQLNIFTENTTSNQWEIIQTINPPTIQENLEFGATVYAFNDFLFISSGTLNKVFIYEFNNSINQYEFNQEINGGTNFGADICAENDTLIVGAYQGNGGVNFGGNVYIYKLQNGIWEFVNEIYNNDYTVYDWFGLGVSIDNGVIVVGAPYEDLDYLGNNYLEKAGALYTFNDTSILSNNDENIIITGTIYPNPFTQTIFIDLENIYKTITVKLFDLTGKELFSDQYLNMRKLKIVLPDLSSGIYTMSIYNNDNLITNTKVIKK